MSSTGKISWPSDLGEWHRKKAGKFKARMKIDKASYKTLQASVGAITLGEFNKNRTARNQPPEVMEIIKTRVLNKHRDLLEQYEDAWPVKILAIAFIENHLQYKKCPRAGSRHHKAATRTSMRSAPADSSTITTPTTETGVANMAIDVDDDMCPLSTPPSDSSSSSNTPKELVGAQSWYNGDVRRLLSCVLAVAAERGLFEVARALVEIGVDVNSSDSHIRSSFSDETAFVRAISKGHEDVALLLLDREATVRPEDLITASRTGQFHIVRAFLDRGIQHRRSTSPKRGSCLSLLKYGVDVNASDEENT